MKWNRKYRVHLCDRCEQETCVSVCVLRYKVKYICFSHKQKYLKILVYNKPHFKWNILYLQISLQIKLVHQRGSQEISILKCHNHF